MLLIKQNNGNEIKQFLNQAPSSEIRMDIVRLDLWRFDFTDRISINPF